MEFGTQIILSFLEKIYDEPRKKRDSIVEYEFNCNSSECYHDIDKFNLCYNVNNLLIKP